MVYSEVLLICSASLGSLENKVNYGIVIVGLGDIVHHGDKSTSERLLKFTAVGKLILPMTCMFIRFS